MDREEPVARELADCIGRYMSEREYRKRLSFKAAEFVANRGFAAPAQSDALTVTALMTFFKWAMQEGPWQGGDLDGGGVQDKAESLGLIVSVPYDPEKHGAYNDYGCDAGDPWFEFSPALSMPSAQSKGAA